MVHSAAGAVRLAGLCAGSGTEDAKIAAAAAISLLNSYRAGPFPVSPNDIRVARSDKGYSATVDKRNNYFATANFDATGRLTNVSKRFTGPLPP